MELNKLDYPMFKITLNDAALLVLADERIRKGVKTLLCYALTNVFENSHGAVTGKEVVNLKKKIRNALYPYTNLEDKIHLDRTKCKNYAAMCKDVRKARRIWIKKLLAHNGY